MSWIALSLRKQSLKSEIAESDIQNIKLSRQIRSSQRSLSTNLSAFNARQSKEIRELESEALNGHAKSYNEHMAARPSDINSDEYKTWKAELDLLQEDINKAKEAVEEYYDGIQEKTETEAKDYQQTITERQDMLETQRMDMNAELQTLQDEIKTEIEQSAIKF